MSFESVKIVLFSKLDGSRCQAQLLDDGSVYVTGDEEIIVEDSPDALKEATDLLLEQGYRISDEVSMP